MSDLINKGIGVVLGIIALIIAVTAIATTNSAVVGTLAWTVLGFVSVGLAVGILIQAFKP